MNIKTIKNGFNLNEIDYEFQEQETEQGFIKYEIVSDSQMLVGTNEGFIFLDLSLSINNKFFENINEFLKELKIYNENLLVRVEFIEVEDTPTEDLIAQKEAELLAVYAELQKLKEK